MSPLRIAVHSWVLAAANLCAVLAGFAAYGVLRPVNQLAVQVPVAASLSLLAFAVWARVQPASWTYDDYRTYFAAYLAAFLWFPILFFPLHFLTQGYLASFSNVLATWAFQAPVNALALFIGYRIVQRRFWSLGKEPG